MRVLVWTPVFAPEIGGIEIITAHLVNALHNCGHELIVLTAHGRLALPDRMDYQGVPIYRFPIIEALRNQNLTQILKIRRQITVIKQQFKPQLVHLHWGGPTPVAYFHLQTAAVQPAPTLITLHDTLQGLRSDTDTINGTCLHKANWIIANSTAIWDDTEQFSPDLPKHMSLLHCCLPLPTITPVPLKTDQWQLLCLGRLAWDKGFDLAISAFATLQAHYPEAQLVIVGDGPMRSDLERQVAELKLQEKVRFTGHVSVQQRWALLNAATLMIIPSRRREAFGLVALEAAQMALPVVATRAGGLTDIVVDQQTGLLVDPGNVTELAAAVSWLLDHPTLARQMGVTAYQRVRQQFDWQTYVDAHDALYKQLWQTWMATANQSVHEEPIEVGVR